jgi:hypothetical protein
MIDPVPGPYVSLPRCRKCGEYGASAEWMPTLRSACFKGDAKQYYPDCDPDTEVLRRRCDHCGFKWVELPLDADPALSASQGPAEADPEDAPGILLNVGDVLMNLGDPYEIEKIDFTERVGFIVAKNVVGMNLVLRRL